MEVSPEASCARGFNAPYISQLTRTQFGFDHGTTNTWKNEGLTLFGLCSFKILFFPSRSRILVYFRTRVNFTIHLSIKTNPVGILSDFEETCAVRFVFGSRKHSGFIQFLLFHVYTRNIQILFSRTVVTTNTENKFISNFQKGIFR